MKDIWMVLLEKGTLNLWILCLFPFNSFCGLSCWALYQAAILMGKKTVIWTIALVCAYWLSTFFFNWKSSKIKHRCDKLNNSGRTLACKAILKLTLNSCHLCPVTSFKEGRNKWNNRILTICICRSMYSPGAFVTE